MYLSVLQYFSEKNTCVASNYTGFIFASNITLTTVTFTVLTDSYRTEVDPLSVVYLKQ